MNKMNNKGFTIIEIILSFSFIMVISVGLFISATNYKNKQQKESAKRNLESYKMNIISDIHKEIDEKGLKSMKTISNGIRITFSDNSTMSITKNSDFRGVLFDKGENGKQNYILKDSGISVINNILLESNKDIVIGTSKANLYKITIEVEHGELGVFPINIVLPAFSIS